MKKKLSIFLIFVLAACIFSSCANVSDTATQPNQPQPGEKTYTVLEAGGSADSSLGIKHNSDISLAVKSITDNDKSNEQKEITPDNTAFSGKYYRTVKSPYYNRTQRQTQGRHLHSHGLY